VPNTDNPLPNRPTPRNESELPRKQQSNTLFLPLNRACDLTEKLLPNTRKSTTEHPAPRRVSLTTLSPEPMREKDRSESAEPT
jgi:hypothetical protein